MWKCVKCSVQKVCYMLVFPLSELAVRYKADSATLSDLKAAQIPLKTSKFRFGETTWHSKRMICSNHNWQHNSNQTPTLKASWSHLNKMGPSNKNKTDVQAIFACKENANGTCRIHKKEALKLWRCHFARSYTFYQFALHVDWCAYSHPEWIQMVDSVQMTGHAGKRFATTTWIIHMPCWASWDHQPAMNQTSTNSLDLQQPSMKIYCKRVVSNPYQTHISSSTESLAPPVSFKGQKASKKEGRVEIHAHGQQQ